MTEAIESLFVSTCLCMATDVSYRYVIFFYVQRVLQKKICKIALFNWHNEKSAMQLFLNSQKYNRK